MFSCGFLRLPVLDGAAGAGAGPFRRDRILACVGTESIPRLRRSKRQRGAPGKTSRAIFAFCSPRPPLGGFTKENGALGLMLFGRTRSIRERKAESCWWERMTLRHSVTMPEGCSRFSSEPTPSHRPWASARARPLADFDASKRTNPANSNGHQPARSSLVDRLRRWPFVRYASNTP